MTLNMYIATIAWLCIVAGFFNRRDHRKHIPLVLTGIGLDLALVVYLQLSRSAIQTALEFRLGIFQQLHIGFSTAALFLYIPTVTLGVRLWYDLRSQTGKNSAPLSRIRAWHRRCAYSALSFRTVGFFLMFSMMK